MKYEITDEVKVIFGRTLHRIKAIKFFASVSKGELGGWIENADNLSQEGNSWISENGMVLGNARVFGDARICGNAIVFDDALICGHARISGNARVDGKARVFGNACVTDNAKVSGNATVAGDGYLCQSNDIIVVGPVGSRRDFTTFYKKSSV